MCSIARGEIVISQSYARVEQWQSGGLLFPRSPESWHSNCALRIYSGGSRSHWQSVNTADVSHTRWLLTNSASPTAACSLIAFQEAYPSRSSLIGPRPPWHAHSKVAWWLATCWISNWSMWYKSVEKPKPSSNKSELLERPVVWCYYFMRGIFWWTSYLFKGPVVEIRSTLFFRRHTANSLSFSHSCANSDWDQDWSRWSGLNNSKPRSDPSLWHFSNQEVSWKKKIKIRGQIHKRVSLCKIRPVQRIWGFELVPAVQSNTLVFIL